MAFGFDRIVEALEQFDLFPKEVKNSVTKVLVTNFEDEPKLAVVELVHDGKSGKYVFPQERTEPYEVLFEVEDNVSIALSAERQRGWSGTLGPFHTTKDKIESIEPVLDTTAEFFESNPAYKKDTEAVLYIYHLKKSAELKLEKIVNVVAVALNEHVLTEYGALTQEKISVENYHNSVESDAETANRPGLFISLPATHADRALSLISYLQSVENVIHRDDDDRQRPAFQYQFFDRKNNIVVSNATKFDMTPVNANGDLIELQNRNNPLSFNASFKGEQGVGFQFTFREESPYPHLTENQFFTFPTLIWGRTTVPSGTVASLSIYCMDNEHDVRLLQQLVVNGLRCQGRNMWKDNKCVEQGNSMQTLEGSTKAPASPFAQQPVQPVQQVKQPKPALVQPPKLAPVQPPKLSPNTQTTPVQPPKLSPNAQTTPVQPPKFSPNTQTTTIQPPKPSAVTPPQPIDLQTVQKQERLQLEHNQTLEAARVKDAAKKEADAKLKRAEEDKKKQLAAAALEAKKKQAILEEAERKEKEIKDERRRVENALKKKQDDEREQLALAQKQEKKAAATGVVLPKQYEHLHRAQTQTQTQTPPEYYQPSATRYRTTRTGRSQTRSRSGTRSRSKSRTRLQRSRSIRRKVTSFRRKTSSRNRRNGRRSKVVTNR